MKLSEAWFLLAEHFEGDKQEWYLCCTLGAGGPDPDEPRIPIPLSVRAAMVERIALDLDRTSQELHYRAAYDSEAFPKSNEEYAHEREGRVLACLMFGWEARDRERSAPRRQGDNHLNRKG